MKSEQCKLLNDSAKSELRTMLGFFWKIRAAVILVMMMKEVAKTTEVAPVTTKTE